LSFSLGMLMQNDDKIGNFGRLVVDIMHDECPFSIAVSIMESLQGQF
jgi:hypothetical protein